MSRNEAGEKVDLVVNRSAEHFGPAEKPFPRIRLRLELKYPCEQLLPPGKYFGAIEKGPYHAQPYLP